MKKILFYIFGFIFSGIVIGFTLGDIANKINKKYNDINLISEKKNNNKKKDNDKLNQFIKEQQSYAQKISLTSKITAALIKARSLSMHEARYYEKLDGFRALCLLCPRECIIENGDAGNCGVRANVDGTLYSLVYSRPVTIAIDPIEKKPFYHFFPGKHTFSLATAGCNLHCLNCQNWQISQLSPFDMPEVKILNPENIVQLAKKNNSTIITFTYSEPVVCFEYVLETAKAARKSGLKTAVVSSGFINSAPLEELCANIDAIKIDLKGITEKFYINYTTAKLQPVLNSLKTIKKSGIWLEIVNLIIPGANDSDEDLKKLCDWIKNNLGSETPLHFSKFFPLYKLKNKPQTPEETMLRAYNIARAAGLKYVYIGNMSSEYSHTFCSKCGKKIIARSGYYISEVQIDSASGKCKFCENRIPGIYE